MVIVTSPHLPLPPPRFPRPPDMFLLPPGWWAHLTACPSRQHERTSCSSGRQGERGEEGHQFLLHPFILCWAGLGRPSNLGYFLSDYLHYAFRTFSADQSRPETHENLGATNTDGGCWGCGLIRYGIICGIRLSLSISIIKYIRDIMYIYY